MIWLFCITGSFLESWTSIVGFFSLEQRQSDLQYCISVGLSHSDTEVTRRDAEHAEGLEAYAQEAGSHLPWR